MISYEIKHTNEFKKSFKKLIKQGKDNNKLLNVVELLSEKQQLGFKYRDHALKSNQRYKGCRDCHIEPDWILIYKYLDKEIILLLVNTGSHSEVFR